jgi:ATP adenylyltransferase
MDHLWTPWRYAYVTGADRTNSCIFCDAPKASDEEARIVHRGTHCYIILNTYPYTNGHVMIVPYAHLDELHKLPADAAAEMMALTQRMESALRPLYHPDGVNLGMNIGKAAGAGVAGHIHMHILPRWVADANFVSVIGETRVLPESLDVTWKRIREALRQDPPNRQG